MHLIAPDGARIGYDVTGRPDGPPIILGHAVPCDRRMWRATAPAMAQHYRVIAIDVRGHGESTAPGPFTTETLVDDWLAVLDAERIERVALCGASIGGMTAMQLAARAPDRVGAVVLIGTSAEREPLRKRLVNRLLLAIARRLGPLGAFDRKLALDLFSAETRHERPALVREVLSWAHEHDWGGFLRALGALVGRPSLLDRLPAIRCPTLVVTGESDRRMPPAKARRIAAGIPGTPVHVVPRAGHLIPLEAPDALLAELLPFLERYWPAPADQRETA